jgi:hypothetical protein
MKIKFIMYDFDTFKTKKTMIAKLNWFLACLKWQLYSTMHLGNIVKVKIFFEQVKSKIGLRKPINLDLEFPEREWDIDIYG